MRLALREPWLELVLGTPFGLLMRGKRLLPPGPRPGRAAAGAAARSAGPWGRTAEAQGKKGQGGWVEVDTLLSSRVWSSFGRRSERAHEQACLGPSGHELRLGVKQIL